MHITFSLPGKYTSILIIRQRFKNMKPLYSGVVIHITENLCIILQLPQMVVYIHSTPTGNQT